MIRSALCCLVLVCLAGCSWMVAPSDGQRRSIGGKDHMQSMRWSIGSESGIGWDLSTRPAIPHKDHLAMSGRYVDLILEWGVDGERVFGATRVIRWPMLRTIPNDTHASLQLRFDDADEPRPLVDGVALSGGRVTGVEIDGVFRVKAEHEEGLVSCRTVFTSVASPVVVDYVELKNVSEQAMEIVVPPWCEEFETEEGVRGKYVITQSIVGDTERLLAVGESLGYGVLRSGRLPEEPPYLVEPKTELAARRCLVTSVSEALVLETPEPVLDRMFEMAKLRVAESIFSTRGGLMHGPGGYNRYLAAIWANDQAEYVNPLFPFLGDAIGNESAMNSFRHFARYVNDEYRPIPSSIIAEGTDVWNGAGDRGDQAMIAYGAARFALASGNEAWGRELWPLIEWCLEYCRRHKNDAGVVASDSDELEGRFPAGDANLCTSVLYYDGLLSAARLADSLGMEEAVVAGYRREATEMHAAIRRHFEAEVEGFATYRYYDGNTVLRSWICIPLCAGMTERVEGTVAALFSPRLWTGNGLLTQAGEKTYWDRSTLYAMRGALFCGAVDEAMPRLIDYSRARLLGSHVPYAIEAYPECNQSHLSAESGLYCRVFTEGLFGIVPAGLRSFECSPHLPDGWDRMTLRRVHAFGQVWDLEVSRVGGDEVCVEVFDAAGRRLYRGVSVDGQTHAITLQK